MLLEFVQDTQTWLREYHSRSMVETVNSTIKRLFTVPLRKRLVERKTTELLARIIICNNTKGVKLEFKKNENPRVMTLLYWMDS